MKTYAQDFRDCHWATVAVALLALMVSAAVGGPLRHGEPYPHMPRVEVVLPEAGGRGFGSGIVIGKHDAQAWVATAAHVVRGGKWIRLHFPHHGTTAAQVAAIDNVRDVAILRCRDVGAPAVRIAEEDPRGVVYVCGYGPRGQFAYGSDRVRLAGTWIEVAATRVRQGDSGGAILSERGRLAGVISGFAQTGASYATIGCRPRAIRDLYGRCRPGVVQKPQSGQPRSGVGSRGQPAAPS